LGKNGCKEQRKGKRNGEPGANPLANKHWATKRAILVDMSYLDSGGSSHLGRSRRRKIKKQVKLGTPCFTAPQMPIKPFYIFLSRGGWLIIS